MQWSISFAGPNIKFMSVGQQIFLFLSEHMHICGMLLKAKQCLLMDARAEHSEYIIANHFNFTIFFVSFGKMKVSIP